MMRIEDEADGEPSWRVPAVTRIVKKVLKDLSKGSLSGDQAQALSVLADALQDNGCTDGAVLAYLRGSKNITRDMHRTRRVLCLIQGGELAEAVAWLDQLAEELDYTYNRLMLAAQDYVGGGGAIYDPRGMFNSVAANKWPQFWAYYDQVTGDKVDHSSLGTFFTDEDESRDYDDGCRGC